MHDVRGADCNHGGRATCHLRQRPGGCADVGAAATAKSTDVAATAKSTSAAAATLATAPAATFAAVFATALARALALSLTLSLTCLAARSVAVRLRHQRARDTHVCVRHAERERRGSICECVPWAAAARLDVPWQGALVG